MISLVVPTFNRPDFAIRTLRYYAAVAFRGEILLGDSSAGEAGERIRATVKELAPTLNVRYVDCVGIDDRLSLHRLSTLVSMPYAAFIGDDDLLFPSGLEACARFLDSHPEYVAANGKAWAFELSAGVHGRLRIVDEYPQPDLPQERPLERLEAHLRNYRVSLFSLHRADAWRAMWARVAEIRDRAFSAELLPCCMSPILGRSKHLDAPYLLRQTHASRYHLPPFSDWLAKPDWQASHDRFCAIAGEHLAKGQALSPEQAAGAVAKLLVDHYIARFKGIDEQLRAGPTGLRAAVDRARNRFRVWRTWNEYSRNLFQRWDSAAEPFRSDFAAARKVFSGAGLA